MVARVGTAWRTRLPRSGRSAKYRTGTFAASQGLLDDGSHRATKETEYRLEPALRLGLRSLPRDALTLGNHEDLSCPIIDLERARSEHPGTLRDGAFDLYRLAVVLLRPIKQVFDVNRP